MSAAPLASARRLLLVLSVLSALTIVAAAIAVFIGSAPISARGVIDALIGRGGDVEDLVVLGLRLPRIAAALLAGGALAVVGVGFQALTRNPLADPSILGVSSGAAFAVVLAQLFGVGTTAVAVLGLTAFAFAGALAVFGALLAGGVWLILGRARQLNMLALGEEAALQLGVEAERLKLRVFIGSSLLTAAVVAFAGPIGFVGLIVPHAVRLVLGPDNRMLVPAALLAGATFLLVADTVARNVIAPAEISVGVITAFCGAPFFIYLLRSRYRSSQP